MKKYVFVDVTGFKGRIFMDETGFKRRILVDTTAREHIAHVLVFHVSQHLHPILKKGKTAYF